MKATNLILDLASLATSVAAGDIYGIIGSMLKLISLGFEMRNKSRNFNVNPTPSNQHLGEYTTTIYIPRLI